MTVLRLKRPRLLLFLFPLNIRTAGAAAVGGQDIPFPLRMERLYPSEVFLLFFLFTGDSESGTDRAAPAGAGEMRRRREVFQPAEVMPHLYGRKGIAVFP